ncbi:MAG: riboflavin synthase [Phenylobacterium sp.]|uniref:riboflavin synthase n=1 Tax=Phenylobacterium sp. TaxID=1871053 RepID=UPI002722C821|nr:riboflavin synthase [Phenylobacterium sp.]MDO8900907.1 riboflavin synthase [Phenylobacterium sp.]
MFTGIITDVGRVRSVRDTDRDRRFEIETRFDLSSVEIGASIAHAGCCLTLVEKGADWFAVEVSGETLDRTTIGAWEPGHPVNLERSARVGDELGGHIVSGHVDGVGEVISVESEGGSHRVKVRVPRPLHRYIAPKGSITVEGVSLTVNEVEDDVFGVNLIPHTWEVTTLGGLKPGSAVNLEIDMLARYLARWRETA